MALKNVIETLDARFDGETCVYKMWHDNGGLLYVGVTGDLLARLSAHASLLPWTRRVGSVTFDGYATRQKAKQAEELAIATEHPVWNRHHRKGVTLSVWGGGGAAPVSDDPATWVRRVYGVEIVA